MKFYVTDSMYNHALYFNIKMLKSQIEKKVWGFGRQILSQKIYRTNSRGLDTSRGNGINY
jgi:hypothetical protein